MYTAFILTAAQPIYLLVEIAFKCKIMDNMYNTNIMLAWFAVQY